MVPEGHVITLGTAEVWKYLPAEFVHYAKWTLCQLLARDHTSLVTKGTSLKYIFKHWKLFQSILWNKYLKASLAIAVMKRCILNRRLVPVSDLKFVYWKHLKVMDKPCANSTAQSCTHQQDQPIAAMGYGRWNRLLEEDDLCTVLNQVMALHGFLQLFSEAVNIYYRITYLWAHPNAVYGAVSLLLCAMLFDWKQNKTNRPTAQRSCIHSIFLGIVWRLLPWACNKCTYHLVEEKHFQDAAYAKKKRTICLASVHTSVWTLCVKLFPPSVCGKIGKKNILYWDLLMHRPLVNVSHCGHCQGHSVIERNIAFSTLEQYSLLLCPESWHCKFCLSTWIKRFILKCPLYGYVIPSVLEDQQTPSKNAKKTPHHHTSFQDLIWC